MCLVVRLKFLNTFRNVLNMSFGCLNRLCDCFFVLEFYVCYKTYHIKPTNISI